jgi:GT2 family glycosyltransferase
VTDSPSPSLLYEPPPAIDEARLSRLPLRGLPVFRPDTSHLPEIDLSLVTYNSGQWFEAFFDSLAAQLYPLGQINLFVIDHSPDDACLDQLEQTIQLIAQRFRSVKLEHHSNRGFGAGHNQTLGLGHSKYVLVSNVDLTFMPDTLIRLVQHAVADDGNGAAWEARQKPYEHPKIYDILTGKTDWVSGACVLLRREAWESVDGFDETFFMYGEDVDLSFRLRARGYALRYCPDAVVWHHSYAQPGKIKDTQYFGATLANMFIRLRFGSVRDILAGLAMQAVLLGHRAPVQDRLPRLLQNYRKLLRDGSEFLTSRSVKIRPQFLKWDYTLHRHGAFVEGADIPSDAPLVSIVVRTYPGRLPLLQQALLSLARQTYRPLEVIVVEDGGDTAKDYVEGLRGSSGLDLVYYSAPKQGRSHTGNLGLALVRGAYAGFLDDDDLLYADHVETLVQALQNDVAHDAVYAHAFEVETAFAKSGWVPYRESSPKSRMPVAFDRQALWVANYIPIQTVLFRRDLYERLGGFSESLDALEDWDLWQRYALDKDFGYVDKTTSLYRMPAGNDRRPERALELADHYLLAKERQALMIRPYSIAELRVIGGLKDPVWVSGKGRRAIRFLTQHKGLYALMRRIREWIKL